MKCAGMLLTISLVVAGNHAALGGGERPLVQLDGDRHFRGEYVKALRALRSESVCADMPVEKMLELCLPKDRRRLRQFTEFSFVGMQGYMGIEIIAKDDRLKRAVWWHCTGKEFYFDKLTRKDTELYKELCDRYSYVPFEECLGRFGWRRPPMREWMPDRNAPAVPPRN